tara:strand:+ start:251 stop:427 length:177 start_codon:yes stop_codon:yes gene_type:complete
MTPFDPAINYGPNDAGISAFSIVFAFLSLIIVSWLFGALYGFASAYFNRNKNKPDNSK